MIRTAFIIAAMTLTAITGAKAQSLPTAPNAAPFSWTGFYIGAHGGYLKAAEDPTVSYHNEPGDAFAVPLDRSGSRSGLAAGLTAGYNYQINRFVLGLEGDITYLGLKGRATATSRYDLWPTLGISETDTVNLQSELGWYGTLRARVGYALTPQFLVYGTGGLAIAGEKLRGSSSSLVHTPAGSYDPGLYYDGSKAGTRIGWAIGAGMEYAITSNITAKLEYLRLHFGETRYSLAAADGGSDYYSVKRDTSANLFRVGLNYKF